MLHHPKSLSSNRKNLIWQFFRNKIVGSSMYVPIFIDRYWKILMKKLKFKKSWWYRQILRPINNLSLFRNNLYEGTLNSKVFRLFRLHHDIQNYKSSDTQKSVILSVIYVECRYAERLSTVSAFVILKKGRLTHPDVHILVSSRVDVIKRFSFSFDALLRLSWNVCPWHKL